ncbi:hypothetical protein H4582DRAFT_1440139 [Lactarius indigo]|nr:hypothetical protein H4582DRAFT_1440139 [Lactarius indigo]
MSFDTTTPSTTTSADCPEWSRYAKPQVRHRAKRTAYVKQRTVTKPQTRARALSRLGRHAATTDLRIRKLEQECPKPLCWNDGLQRQLHMQNRNLAWPVAAPSTHLSLWTTHRDLKGERMSQNVDKLIFLVSFVSHSPTCASVSFY